MTGNASEATQIRRWAPGSSVEVVYRSPDQGPTAQYAVSGPMCGPGLVSIMRQGWSSSMPQELLTAPVGPTT